MKVALVHDYLKEYGGAERVLEALHELFPDAPIYTSVYLPDFLGPHRERFQNMNIRTTFLQAFPFKAKLISPFRLLAPLAFKSLDLSDFDVIIVSQTGAYFPTLVRKGNAILVCYSHTPPRYLYGYKTAREWKNNGMLLVLGEIANHFLRMVDFSASNNVDVYVSNSNEVQGRIEKFYRKKATVINPPVDMYPIPKVKKEDFYIAGGRLARAKGMEVIVNAFNVNKKKLKIFGKGFAGYEDELRALAGKNIEFVGEVTDQQKRELMAKAKAYVFASYDEDFGITPVEAQSMGIPVIAFRSGGVRETVIDGKTGIFYTKNNPEELVEAIEKLERLKIRPEDCRRQAEKFSGEQFGKRITEVVSNA